MEGYRFIDKKGTFRLEQPQDYSYLYFPIAGEKGLKSSLTPELGGDAKLDQNTFLLEPVSAENLHNNRSSRNFWCHIKDRGNWSVTGVSAEEQAKKYTQGKDRCELEAGILWQRLTRESEKYQLKAKITNFVPYQDNVEIMMVELTNMAKQQVTLTPTAAVPIYGRSADNIRDHRHVTSLLHRIHTTKEGVCVTPTLSFDERGHQKNNTTYFVNGFTGEGKTPKDFYPVMEDFVGEGGNLEWPEAVVRNLPGVPENTDIAGFEALGGLHFSEIILEPGESKTYVILIGVTDDLKKVDAISSKYNTKDKVEQTLAETNHYWERQLNVAYHTKDTNFDAMMHWISFQPILRRIYGCSFLPHHDYGKGGRGWRDLWQDCLALLILNPNGVRQMLIDNFGGVRMDGTNATIIGNRQGEFIADRNNITRVWMDHGVWPMMTTKFYLDQTGDLDLLLERVPYFKDKQIKRGTAIDAIWDEESLQKDETGEVYEGTILEHLLIQNLTSFYEVGEHNEIRLRGADWNDAIDMAPDRGESVAFTNAYARNLKDLAELLAILKEKMHIEKIEIASELSILLETGTDLYESVERKLEILDTYTSQCAHTVNVTKNVVDIDDLMGNLSEKADWMMEHIRNTEWITGSNNNGWFNGYYDNHGNRVEGETKQGVRMMLTGQVFSVMAGTATHEQIEQIVKSADAYLYQENAGGYRLNTDFHEVKMDMGRMFGFSYGDKENGAVFSHMAVMYANALYQRGFAKEGYKSLSALYRQSANFSISKIYPGIPEYFNARGRGMYHYLTGAASWYMMTVITEMFGVKGCYGNLVLEPKLLAEQFDENGRAALSLQFQGKKFQVNYENPENKEYGTYQIKQLFLDGIEQEVFYIEKEKLQSLSENVEHEIRMILG